VTFFSVSNLATTYVCESYAEAEARLGMKSLQVKDPVMHCEGADVIQHMIDHFTL
jgi:hypothetical protein